MASPKVLNKYKVVITDSTAAVVFTAVVKAFTDDEAINEVATRPYDVDFNAPLGSVQHTIKTLKYPLTFTATIAN